MDVEQAKLDQTNLSRLRQTIAELYGAADQVEAMGKQLWLKIAQQLCSAPFVANRVCRGSCRLSRSDTVL